jgi:hypothetical protein
MAEVEGHGSGVETATPMNDVKVGIPAPGENGRFT